MRYMGGKSRIAKHIVPIIQEYIDSNQIKNYYEPFVGGANIIDKIKRCDRYGSDLNPYLIALLKHVQNGGHLYEQVSKELYDKAREAYNSDDTSGFEDWQIGNIGFLASYCGRWFDGGYAKPGYERGRYRDYYKEALENIVVQAPSLNGIVFECYDYRAIDPKESVIYCDPPYAGTKEYANAKKFDYDKFWEKMRDWSKKNIVIVSEQNAPEDWRCIWENNVTRSIKPDDKRQATEKLFIHKTGVH